MIGVSSVIADLLADCEVCGIRLAFTGNGGLTIDAPQDGLTPDLLARLKAHKADLLDILRPPLVATPPRPKPTGDAPAKAAGVTCRCGSTTWRDVPIHNGQSVRQDCGRCGRFLDFSIWYGNTLHNAQ